MKVARSKSRKAKRIKHLFAAAIYYIWSVRNARIFQASIEPSGSLVRRILQMGFVFSLPGCGCRSDGAELFDAKPGFVDRA
ncbi:hypothetical protein Dimus_034668 [Dionaea muscipula]